MKITMTEDQFDAQFKPEMQSDEPAAWRNYSQRDPLIFVAAAQCRCWSYMDCDDCDGARLVSGLFQGAAYYVIAQLPYVDDGDEYIVRLAHPECTCGAAGNADA